MTDAEITLKPEGLMDGLEKLARIIGANREGNRMELAAMDQIARECLPVFQSLGMEDDGEGGLSFDHALSRSTLPREGQGELVEPVAWTDKTSLEAMQRGDLGNLMVWPSMEPEHSEPLYSASALSPSPAVRDGVEEALREALVVIDADADVETWNRVNAALRALSTQEQGK